MPNQRQQRTYADRIAEARRQAIGTAQDPTGPKAEALRRMYQAYARMLVDIQADSDTARITDDRADALRASVGERLEQLQGRLSASITEAERDVIREAVRAHRQAADEVASMAGVSIDIGEQWAKVPTRVFEQSLQRRGIAGAETLQSIIRRNIQNAADDIDRAINSAIGRGVSWRELTTTIADEMARDDAVLAQALQEVEASDLPFSKSDVPITEVADRLGLEGDDLRRAKSLIYDARRIAVTEINTAYDEADKTSAAVSPVVDLVRWRTSSRHAGLPTSPDICTMFEKRDIHGFGPGLYHPSRCPSHPHPHCMCRVETVLREPQDYGGPTKRSIPDQPNLSEKQMREALASLEGERTVTDAYAQRQRQMFERVNAAIYDTPRT